MHTIQQQKTPKWFKAVQESEQTFFHRRHSDCQRKNANQNHNESIASCLLEWLLTKKKQEITKAGWTVVKTEPLGTLGENVSWCSHYRKQYKGSS